MTGGETTIVAGIEIPSTDPAFLAVVLGVHIPLGLACVVIGAIAMLSEKRRGRHSRFALGRELSLVRTRSDVVRLRLDRAHSAPAPLALLGQTPYRRAGAVVHSDAGRFLRRQWKAIAALEGLASLDVPADTYRHWDTAHRSRAFVAAVSASARREFLTGRHPEYRALGSRG